MKIISAPDYQSMSRKAANIVSAQVILYPESVLGLATGNTQLGIYHQLVEWYRKGDIDFSKVHTVNLDEYCGLPGSHTQSYRYYMNQNLFKDINVPLENTHLPDGMAADFDTECARYDQLINDLGGIDLQLLGIGHNGHIGFNEPDQAFDKMTHRVHLSRRTIDTNVKLFENPAEMPIHAITMGIKAIMQARKILLVANGQDKADILFKALQGPVTPAVPASILQLHPDVTVVADVTALSKFA
jgi:glucosamine-6-phosphate deaminase